MLHGSGNGRFEQPSAVVTLITTINGSEGMSPTRRRRTARPHLHGGTGVLHALRGRDAQSHYPAGGPLLDLGRSSKARAWPIQIAAGSFVPASTSRSNCRGPASGAAYHVLGPSQLNAPFKGGTLVSQPFVSRVLAGVAERHVSNRGSLAREPFGIELVFQSGSRTRPVPPASPRARDAADRAVVGLPAGPFVGYSRAAADSSSSGGLWIMELRSLRVVALLCSGRNRGARRSSSPQCGDGLAALLRACRASRPETQRRWSSPTSSAATRERPACACGDERDTSARRRRSTSRPGAGAWLSLS